MAEDDIYGSKQRYERFTQELQFELIPPAQRRSGSRQTRRGLRT